MLDKMIGLPPKHLIRLLRTIPNFLWPLKVIVIRKSLRRVGSNVSFGPNCSFHDHRLIDIGNNVFIGDGCVITCVVPVNVGNNVMFGPQVMIVAGDHNIKKVGVPMNRVHEGGVNLPVTIEDDVWLGARSLVLKGVSIGEGAVIGAGAIVTKNILPYSINLGQPAKFVKARFSRDELAQHLLAVKSKYTIDGIATLYEQNGADFQV